MRVATWNVNSIRARVVRTVDFAVREDIDAYREWKEAQKIAKARCASCGEPIPAGTLKCSNPKCAAA